MEDPRDSMTHWAKKVQLVGKCGDQTVTSEKLRYDTRRLELVIETSRIWGCRFNVHAFGEFGHLLDKWSGVMPYYELLGVPPIVHGALAAMPLDGSLGIEAQIVTDGEGLDRTFNWGFGEPLTP